MSKSSSEPGSGGSSQLAATNLTKRYRGRTVVEGLDISLSSGEIVGLLGPNGAGKTTCFYMIVGLVRMDAGAILLDGTDLSRAPMHARARAGIGYLPQEASVFRKLSVKDNLRAVVELRGDLDRESRRQLVDRLLDEFRLTDVQAARGEQLSGGERRRVEIARALAAEPAFMLLDEPFSGVDPISVADIKDEIRDLAERRIGVLITDHNVRETLDICDRAYIVNDGHVIAAGDADAILSDETVRSVYLGERFEL
ncbi:MAG: LPS export ABC transporter ATP-binding protein [Gammaproteobacteria bacterium]|nr:LPS export ABC transporter ATP-binding protein [Gammaproteobacteria bacterium]MDE0451978.1 LPS export ABC transporter ATP-binding protein [Gammaproteobacteria bacterium]